MKCRPKRLYELDSARETLVSLGIVVLEANLELDSLHKVAAFLAVVGLVKQVTNGASHA